MGSAWVSCLFYTPRIYPATHFGISKMCQIIFWFLLEKPFKTHARSGSLHITYANHFQSLFRLRACGLGGCGGQSAGQVATHPEQGGLEARHFIAGSLIGNRRLMKGCHLFEQIHGKDPFLQIWALEQHGVGQSRYRLIDAACSFRIHG